MKTIIRKYNSADVYTALIEESAEVQIKQLCDQPFTKDCRIAIMPDVHAGAGCVIGFTANLGDLVIPNLIGVDIGCGMLVVCLGKTEMDNRELDNIIHNHVPAGMNTHDVAAVRYPALRGLHCYNDLKNVSRIECSLGTLGGGNHFIEVDVDDGNQYLVIHTGSRNLGKQVAEHYQQLAYDTLIGKHNVEAQRKALIEEYKASGRSHELQDALKAFHANHADVPRELCYLTGENRKMYLHDMQICQDYAVLNRRTIANIILQNLLGHTVDNYEHFETIHNYIDLQNNIIRKGAVSAQKNEKLLIPINMRDGSLICVGKGNPEWNYSAPHGAGRLFSRGVARKMFTVEAFANEMEGIYTTSVGQDTLDECPMAYKPIDSIVNNIGPTVDIVKIIRPVYNFKASE